MGDEILDGGFAEAPVEAAAAFRAVLEAMARPGHIARVAGARPPQPLSVAAGTLLLTLADPTTPIYLAGATDTEALRGWLTFHTGAPFAGPGEAAFALGIWADLAPLEAYALGTPEFPDRSASLIVEMPDLAAEGARLTGPGIETEARLSLPTITPFQQNAALFPLGLDFYFTAADRLACLPRTTRVEAG